MDCCILCLTQVPNAPEVTKMNFPFTEDHLGHHAHRGLRDGWDCFWGSWGEISWQPCNYLLVGIVQHSLFAAAKCYPADRLPVQGRLSVKCETTLYSSQPNSEFSVSRMIWNAEALMAPRLSPKATPTEGGSHVKLCFCQQAESSGSQLRSRSLSLHLICIWDIN